MEHLVRDELFHIADLDRRVLCQPKVDVHVLYVPDVQSRSINQSVDEPASELMKRRT